jgi:hypothetical protein
MTRDLKLVPYAAHGLDGAGGGGAAQLAPEIAHVRVHQAVILDVVVAPDLPQQLLGGEDPPRVFRKVRQELELARGQAQRSAGHPGIAALQVDDQLADNEWLGRGRDMGIARHGPIVDVAAAP